MSLRYEEFDFAPIREAHEAFWSGELDRPLVLLSGRSKNAKPAPEQQDFIPAYGRLPIEQIVDIAERNLGGTWYGGDDYPYVFTNYGAGVAAVYTGLAIGRCSDHGGVWFKPATDAALADLQVEARMDAEWFVHTDRYMHAMVDRLGERVQITLPDLGGMLDILASIRGNERLLMDLIDEPEQVERLVWETCEAWWQYYEHFCDILRGRCAGTMAWAPVWSPQRTYMFQSDFAYMISPQMFARLVVPELTESCGRIEHGFYHLDGIGQLPHLDLLLAIDELRGVQWVPGAGKKNPCDWPEVFKKILAAGKRIQTWAVRPEEVFEVIEYTGGAKGIIFDVAGVEEDDADRYLARVQQACMAARRKRPVG
jgi:hypothetical protein